MKSPYYINVNGKYGVGAYEKGDYDTIKDLLSEMDRLGIYQTVVYHVNAKDLHPVYGNGYLIDDIRQTLGAKERVIPAFAVNPAMLVGRGEMEHLESYLESGEVGCVVIFPVTNRFRMVEYRRVFDRIRKYAPVVMMDVTELTSEDLEDLAAIAGDYPELNFVIKQVMWWQYSRVFDLMNRRKNIYADISWLHVRDAIKIICEHVGAERLVFGVGYRSHNGAALAGLSYADISQDQKDAISYDNFTKLLPKRVYNAVVKNRKTIDDQINNRFWKDFIAEKGVKDVLVIDAHSHIGPFARSWILTENGIDGQIAALKRDMDKLGIDKIISQPETALFGHAVEGNRQVEDAIDDKERFRGNLVINPIHHALYSQELFDNFFSGGYFCGMKAIPEYIGVDVDDERFSKAWEYADAHDMHVLIHCWEGKHGNAKKVMECAAKYPNATFIIGHTGGGTEGRRQCEEYASDSRFNNCMFDYCGTFTSEVRWEDTLKKIDYKRVVFGTDTIVHDMAWEMGRLLSTDIPDYQIEAILGANMERVLKKTKLPKRK
ncbi:MAG: amidohydrolase family protein [Clostridia bacterium]|nr:amidohydrolase family protein [Clostridia bacterium]